MIISLLVVLIVAAGIITAGVTGFFTASKIAGGNEAAPSDNAPAFRLSLTTENNAVGGQVNDGTPENENNDEAENNIVDIPVTGNAVVTGGTGGGHSGISVDRPHGGPSLFAGHQQRDHRKRAWAERSGRFHR